MAHRSANGRRVTLRDAEVFFLVRIKVERRKLAREHQYDIMHQHDIMHRWLDQQIGAGRYWFVGERAESDNPDTMVFYFVEVADAQAFIERFSCGVLVIGERPHKHRGPPENEIDDN
jgi:hypothetical protein